MLVHELLSHLNDVRLVLQRLFGQGGVVLVCDWRLVVDEGLLLLLRLLTFTLDNF